MWRAQSFIRSNICHSSYLFGVLLLVLFVCMFVYELYTETKTFKLFKILKYCPCWLISLCKLLGDTFLEYMEISKFSLAEYMCKFCYHIFIFKYDIYYLFCLFYWIKTETLMRVIIPKKLCMKSGAFPCVEVLKTYQLYLEKTFL